MLVIPNTTTTALESDAGAALFPGPTPGLTPFAAGYVFVANNPAQISIARGATAGTAGWTPYAAIAPTMIPFSTDRAGVDPLVGRYKADYIWGFKALDAIAGTHAQVFGAFFQPGEAGFIPSNQFSGTVTPSGGFTPGSTFLDTAKLTAVTPLAIPSGVFTAVGFPQGFTINTNSNVWTPRSGSGTGLFVNAAGVYEVIANAVFVSGAGTERGLELLQNGVLTDALIQIAVNPAPGTGTGMTATAVLQLASGDRMEASVLQDTGGNLNLFSATLSMIYLHS